MQSPANTAMLLPPKPEVQFLYAENVDSAPLSGTPIYGRRCPDNTTIVAEEDGKFICRPGGNFLVNCIPPENNSDKIMCSIALGWWEEPC